MTGRPATSGGSSVMLSSTIPAMAYTVATGVTGDPAAPGRRSGGAVNRKRER